jgi:muramoyltetrapeptide carboxypeptidase LdcA involved in peptidoglycan recycling
METYRLHKKSIHRALFSLRLHGILDKIKGLLLGYLVGSDDPEYPGDERDLKELVLEATDGYDFPIMQIGEVGHYVENTQIPVGAKATIDATDLKFRIDESVCV